MPRVRSRRNEKRPTKGALDHNSVHGVIENFKGKLQELTDVRAALQCVVRA
jgi:hypothetical protein